MVLTALLFLWMFSHINNNGADANRLPLHREPLIFERTLFRMPGGVVKERVQHPQIFKAKGLMQKSYPWQLFRSRHVLSVRKPVVIRVEKPRKRIRAIVYSENTVRDLNRINEFQNRRNELQARDLYKKKHL